MIFSLIKTWSSYCQMIQEPNLLHWQNKKDSNLGNRQKIQYFNTTNSFIPTDILSYPILYQSRPINSWDQNTSEFQQFDIYFQSHLFINQSPTKFCQKDLLIKALKELHCQCYYYHRGEISQWQPMFNFTKWINSRAWERI